MSLNVPSPVGASATGRGCASAINAAERRKLSASMPRGYLSRMSDLLRVACVQMTSGADKTANIAKAEQLVARAAATGADVIVLPEKWNGIGDGDQLRALAE